MTYELGYSVDDDGVWITCSKHYGYGKNLGFSATPQDAVEAEKELGECPYCKKEEQE